MVRTVVVWVVAVATLCGMQTGGRAAPLPPVTTLQFSGYTWEVRSGEGGPGPNHWSAQNVWVDAQGDLHLKLSPVKGQWYAAELYTTQHLGFGVYQWQVIGRIDQLDPNVVFGLFNYPTADIGPDGTHEIDIEWARWGNAQWSNLNYTVWPAREGVTLTAHTAAVTLAGTYTTQRFTWRSHTVFFQSLHGHTDTNTNALGQWRFTPRQPLRTIPQKPLPVHMNLWLVDGQAPTNGQAVEIVIRKFTYTPATAATSTPPVIPTASAGMAAPSNLAWTASWFLLRNRSTSCAWVML